MKRWRLKRRVVRNRARQRAQPRSLRLELLRDRITLDGSGLGVSDPLPWFDPGAITYSFAPDGTTVGGDQSELYGKFSALGDAALWERQFDDAFNLWLAPLGVGVREVSDSGSRFGVSGRTQDDLRFGDIRIAAIPLTDGVLATSVPNSVIARGTWAGDILINSDANWSSLQEVFSVAMHEFGHVLGLEHSTDPASPMFVHGLNQAVAPTQADIDALKELYAGIQFKDESESGGEDESESEGEVETSSSSELPVSESGEDSSEDESSSTPVVFPFDQNAAIALAPTVGSLIRYSAAGEIVDGSTLIYRLDPTVNEPEGLDNLTLTLQSINASYLDAEILVYDSLGKPVETKLLHNGQGGVVIQALGLESDEVHYVAIASHDAALLKSKAGSFEIVIDFLPEIKTSRKIGEIKLDQDHPIAEQAFQVASSRLVHLHVDRESETESTTIAFAQLVNDAGESLTQIAIEPGRARSAPLVFLPAGDYTLRFSASNGHDALTETKLSVFLDEVSIDLGPGLSDPTGQPYPACDEPGADPNLCVGYVPINPDPPTFPDPSLVPDSPEFSWWYGFGYSCDDYAQSDFGNPNIDPLWSDYYAEACGPTPVDPTPVDPTSANPWQNSTTPNDVSGDSGVTPLDALLIINLLGRSDGPSISVNGDRPGIFADVNGDFMVTPRDALVVINALQRIQAQAMGELPASNGLSGEIARPLNDAAIGQLF